MSRISKVNTGILSLVGVSVIVVLIIGSSLFTLAFVTGPEVRQTAVSEQHIELSSWLLAYGHSSVVTSDVNFLGTYVAIGGNVPTWFPDPVTVATNGSIVFDFSGILLAYYSDPTTFSANASIFVATDIMKSTGIFSAGGVWTKPNSFLTDELLASGNLVYDDGSNQVFVS